MNAQEQFVVISLTRQEIANLCNDVIEEQQLPVAPFTSDDDRLTNSFCSKVASEWADMLNEDLSNEDRGDAEREMIECAIRVQFGRCF